MENLVIALTDEQLAFLQTQATQGGRGSAADYVRSLILAEQKRLARKEFEATLLEALEGPRIPVDQEFWDSIRREALEGLAPEEIRP